MAGHLKYHVILLAILIEFDDHRLKMDAKNKTEVTSVDMSLTHNAFSLRSGHQGLDIDDSVGSEAQRRRLAEAVVAPN